MRKTLLEAKKDLETLHKLPKVTLEEARAQGRRNAPSQIPQGY